MSQFRIYTQEQKEWLSRCMGKRGLARNDDIFQTQNCKVTGIQFPSPAGPEGTQLGERGEKGLTHRHTHTHILYLYTQTSTQKQLP